MSSADNEDTAERNSLYHHERKLSSLEQFSWQKLKRRKATCEYETGLNWMSSKVSNIYAH